MISDNSEIIDWVNIFSDKKDVNFIFSDQLDEAENFLLIPKSKFKCIIIDPKLANYMGIKLLKLCYQYHANVPVYILNIPNYTQSD